MRKNVIWLKGNEILYSFSKSDNSDSKLANEKTTALDSKLANEKTTANAKAEKAEKAKFTIESPFFPYVNH